MLLLKVDILSLPSGANIGLGIKTTLGFAAEKVELISCLIFFSKYADLLFMYEIFKVITYFSGPISLSLFKQLR